MNILLVVTAVWITSGQTTTDQVGLFSTVEDCQAVGNMIGQAAFTNGTPQAFSFTCTQTTQG